MEYLILVIALAAIVLGANYLVEGSVSIAKKLHLSDFIIGALIVGVGTSMPEMAVSVMGAVRGNADIAIGNVIGSNIFNVFGILGITAVIFPVAVSKSNFRFDLPLCIFVSVLSMLLTYNFFNGSPAEISRADGIILLGLFCVFITLSFLRDRRNPVPQKNDIKENGSPIWISLIQVGGGLAVLITGCNYFVDEAVVIARNLGVGDAFISITLIACGTSLPELAASITAAFKKNSQLALGNIVGSNIFNILLILGLSSVITPLNTDGITMTDYCVMIVSSILPLLFGFKGRISRIGGFVMILCFIAYTVWMLLG